MAKIHIVTRKVLDPLPLPLFGVYILNEWPPIRRFHKTKGRLDATTLDIDRYDHIKNNYKKKTSMKYVTKINNIATIVFVFRHTYSDKLRYRFSEVSLFALITCFHTDKKHIQCFKPIYILHRRTHQGPSSGVMCQMGLSSDTCNSSFICVQPKNVYTVSKRCTCSAARALRSLLDSWALDIA